MLERIAVRGNTLLHVHSPLPRSKYSFCISPVGLHSIISFTRSVKNWDMENAKVHMFYKNKLLFLWYTTIYQECAVFIPRSHYGHIVEDKKLNRRIPIRLDISSVYSKFHQYWRILCYMMSTASSRLGMMLCSMTERCVIWADKIWLAANVINKLNTW